MTLRLRLFLWYGGVILVTGAVLVVSLYLVVSYNIRSEFHRFLGQEYEEIARISMDHFGDRQALERSLETEVGVSRYLPMVCRLYDARAGKELLLRSTRDEERYENLPVPRLDANAGLQKGLMVTGDRDGAFVMGDVDSPDDIALTLAQTEADELHFLTGWLDEEKHPGVILQVGLGYVNVSRRLLSLRCHMLAVFAVILGIALAGGHWLASRGLRPMHELADMLEHVDARDLSYRLPEQGREDEIGRIMRSTNVMLGHLESAFQQLGSFTGYAAHELRTPLAAAKLRLEVAVERERDSEQYARAIEDALEQLSALNTLVDNLLLLATLEARPGSFEREDVDLGGPLSEIVEFFAILGDEREVNVTLTCPAGAKVTGNPALLRRLFSNLIENAVANTPPGGEARLEVAPTEGGCWVTVRDTGRGMTSVELSRAFERFYRGDTSRSRGAGRAGLGLSICKKIVEAHAGIIKAESEPEKGTTFSVYLPLR